MRNTAKHWLRVAASCALLVALNTPVAAAGMARCEMPSGCPMMGASTSQRPCHGESISTMDCCSMEQPPAVPEKTVEAVTVISPSILESGRVGSDTMANDLRLEPRATEPPSYPPLPLYTLFTALLI